jgi:DNA transposition AAA+ family ATPase
MSFIVNSKREKEPIEVEQTNRLRRLIEDSDLSLYQIASLIGTSPTNLSMWLAGTTRPHMTELDEIEKLIRSTPLI